MYHPATLSLCYAVSMKKNTHRHSTHQAKVDENVVRLNSLLTIFLVLAGFSYPLFWVLATLDIAFRIFGSSPITVLSRLIIKSSGIKPVLIAAAPKKFAAKIAFGLMILMLICQYFGFTAGNNILAGILITALSLESFFRYCFACTLYPLFSVLRK